MLLVEDNGDARTMLAEAFTELAYQVVPAESAEEALDLLAREPVDVIVADIGLPGMDGYEFLHRARQLRMPTEPLALAVTGYGQEGDVRKARDAGYVEHFVKPVDVEAIDQRIRSCVRPSQP
jgi:CheY-like chemotaxis protein